jgi:hypothetical protein
MLVRNRNTQRVTYPEHTGRVQVLTVVRVVCAKLENELCKEALGSIDCDPVAVTDSAHCLQAHVHEH